MTFCPNCGTDIEEGKKFCRQCGTPYAAAEDATTWRLPPPTTADVQQPTVPIRPGPTAPPEAPTTAPYVPPADVYTPPPHPVAYQPPIEQGRNRVAIGEWLSGGWQIYKENAVLMSLATLLIAALGTCTAGVLAGPMLMGMYRMAFKTMRGERPEIGDLFNWRGKFLQAFLAFLIIAAVHLGLGAVNSDVLWVIALIGANPLLVVFLSLVLPMILERNVDVGPGINSVGRMVFSRDWLIWWVLGFVLFIINLGGLALCGVGFLLTLPITISAAAVGYRSIFGIDDPNRTMP
ncbi:MAG TPA: zinc-ribbon domain-containing protein [Blastocatellia bacterium]|nr:zinc-ribbon domain-containing protein [Blastocatellia bacterium]